MLDDWSKEEGVEMVEIGSGLLVILLIFMLGLVGECIFRLAQFSCWCWCTVAVALALPPLHSLVVTLSLTCMLMHCMYYTTVLHCCD